MGSGLDLIENEFASIVYQDSCCRCSKQKGVVLLSAGSDRGLMRVL